MAVTAVLKIEVRKEVSKKDNKKLLNDGYIIGVINHKGMDSIPVAVRKDEFRRVLKENGRNALLKLQDSDNNSYDVMVKTIELSPMKYEYHHVDFQVVSLTDSIKVDITLKFTGVEFLESKRLILNRQMDTIRVSGLPQDIPDTIEVDVSDKNSGDCIFVSDLKFDNGITCEVDPTHLVANFNEAKASTEDLADDEDTVVESEVALNTEE
jgi:large subunit ribosomal protein L25